MTKLFLCLLTLVLATPAMAQNAPVYPDRNGSYQGAQGVVCVQTGGTFCPSGSAADPIFVTSGNSLCHISTATTTVCKTGAGVIHTLSVNNLGTVASTTTVYANTAGSGTVIAVINTLAGQTSYIYDITFATGLTVVTMGTVAPDITVSYR